MCRGRSRRPAVAVASGNLAPDERMSTLKLVIAVAKVYTLVFLVILLAILLQPGPFFGFAPTGIDNLIRAMPGLAMLAVGWAWLLSIRNGVERP